MSQQMQAPRRVKCLDCGHEWESKADTPRCGDPDDVCGRSRNTVEVDDTDIDVDDRLPDWSKHADDVDPDVYVDRWLGSIFDVADAHDVSEEDAEVMLEDAGYDPNEHDVDDALELVADQGADLDPDDQGDQGDQGDDARESFDGPVWLLECPDCGSHFDGASVHDECSNCGDHVSPATVVRIIDDGPDPLVGLGVGDEIAISLEDRVQVMTGEITEVGSGGWDVPETGAHVAIYVRGVDAVDDVLVLESTIEHAGDDWSPVTALDLDVGAGDDSEHRLDLGRVKSIQVEDLHDPRVERVDELEDAGLSGREAEVVALKERGYTHAKIADIIGRPKSTVDEYSRRARNKVKQARRLVETAGTIYS